MTKKEYCTEEFLNMMGFEIVGAGDNWIKITNWEPVKIFKKEPEKELEVEYVVPDKIDLYGETYQIKKVTQEEMTCKFCDEECLGKIVWDERTIYVVTDNPKYPASHTLLHELGHYFGYYYNLGRGEMFAESFARFVGLIINLYGLVFL